MRDDSLEVLGEVARAAEEYLQRLPTDPVLGAGADAAARSFAGALPDRGLGARAAIDRLLDDGVAAATRSSGPRFFHFVTGGATPAALGADWLASLLDQNAFSWVSSPLGARIEEVAVAWLQDLFELPPEWGGVLTTGATAANFTALAAARGWWGERHGIDVDEVGTHGLPPLPIFSSGYVHPSATKALAMLGFGRSTVRRLARDPVGRLDLEALETELRALRGAPALLIGNAGEVNAGDFDPIAEHGLARGTPRRLAARRRRLRALRAAEPARVRAGGGRRAGELGDQRRAQVAERALRLRLRLRTRAEAARLRRSASRPRTCPRPAPSRAVVRLPRAGVLASRRARSRSGPRSTHTDGMATGSSSSGTSTSRSASRGGSTRRPSSSGSPTSR